MSAPAPPPPPPPPPPPGWKSNWREERAKEEAKSKPIKIPGSGPESPKQSGSGPQSPKSNVGSGPDGSFTQYDRLPDKLQNTLSKDKKPFTYTPAGIDLSEIKSSKFQKKVNKAKQQGEYSTVCGPGSPELNEYGQQPPLWPDDIQDISEYCNNPAELDESMINPRYTGSKIPSRSFKVLQALTATSDDEESASPAFSPRAQGYPSSEVPISSQIAPPPPPPPPQTAGGSSIRLLDFAPPPPPAPYLSTTPVSDFTAIPPVPPPPSFVSQPSSSLYSKAIPVYKKVPPPVPPKPQRGVYRPVPSPPTESPITISPSRPPQPPFSRPAEINEWPPLNQRAPYSETFYQSTVKPVFKTYTPPPTTRQTVRSGPNFNETTTHRSGPGYDETSSYATYTSPSYSDGTRTLPLRREVRQSHTKTSYQSKPYYQSPYQSLLDTPQFQDPFKYGMTPTYTNPHLEQFKFNKDPHSAPIREQPFFGTYNGSIGSAPQRQTTSATQNTSERPLSMTSRFFDEINQLFDQTSANISREMYGTDF